MNNSPPNSANTSGANKTNPKDFAARIIESGKDALVSYRKLEGNKRWQGLMKTLDVGMLNSFHLPVMHGIFASKFGWGAPLSLLAMTTFGMVTTPLGLIVPITIAAMGFTIATRLPVLFPETVGNKFLPWLNKKFPRIVTPEWVQHLKTPLESRVTTQKTVGVTLGITGLISMFASGSAPESATAGALYGGLSGKSNWTQGWRFWVDNQNAKLAEGEKKTDVDEALYNSPLSRWLSGKGLFVTIPLSIGLITAAALGVLPVVPVAIAAGMTGIFAGMRNKTFGKMVNYPPLIAGLSMTIMGLAMTAKAGSTFSEILTTAISSPSIIAGTALFLGASVFQGLRVSGRCSWGPSFGRVLAGAGMVVVAGFTAANMPMLSMIGMAGFAATSVVAAAGYVAGNDRMMKVGLGGMAVSAGMAVGFGLSNVLGIASFVLSSASALSNFLVARAEDENRLVHVKALEAEIAAALAAQAKVEVATPKPQPQPQPQPQVETALPVQEAVPQQRPVASNLRSIRLKPMKVLVSGVTRRGELKSMYPDPEYVVRINRPKKSLPKAKRPMARQIYQRRYSA